MNIDKVKFYNFNTSIIHFNVEMDEIEERTRKICPEVVQTEGVSESVWSVWLGYTKEMRFVWYKT